VCVCGGRGCELRNADFSLYFIVDKRIFLLKLFMDACHINTVMIDFLNDLSWLCKISFTVKSQGLRFGWHNKGMEVRSDLYLRCVSYKEN
jgi:hypothetical protein